MKKQIIALFLLLVLLLPMFAGIARIKRLPRDRQQPESRWIVEIDPDRIVVTDDKGERASIAKADLTGAVVETNDTGPSGIDFWWLLFDAAEQMACAIPQGATGEQALIDYLQSLPGFDNTQMTNAARSTDNATFVLWTRVA